METFLRWFHEIRDTYGFCIEIYSSSIMDWCIKVGYKSTMPQHGTVVILIQDCDVDLAFAKAQVKLKDWLMENEGGY